VTRKWMKWEHRQWAIGQLVSLQYGFIERAGRDAKGGPTFRRTANRTGTIDPNASQEQINEILNKAADEMDAMMTDDELWNALWGSPLGHLTG
jgi:hypothetical protein